MLTGTAKGVGEGRRRSEACIAELQYDPREGDSTVDRSVRSVAWRPRAAKSAPASRRDSLGRNRWLAIHDLRDFCSRGCHRILRSKPAGAQLHVCWHVRVDPSGGHVGHRVPSPCDRVADVSAAPVSRCGRASCLRDGGCQRSRGQRLRRWPSASYVGYCGRRRLGNRLVSDPSRESRPRRKTATLPVTTGERLYTRPNEEEIRRGRAYPFGSNLSGSGNRRAGRRLVETGPREILLHTGFVDVDSHLHILC